MISAIEQLRADRRHALNAWLVNADGNPRWPGDDGRILFLDEYPFWPSHIKDAEAATFAALDAVYEAAKAALVDS